MVSIRIFIKKKMIPIFSNLHHTSDPDKISICHRMVRGERKRKAASSFFPAPQCTKHCTLCNMTHFTTGYIALHFMNYVRTKSSTLHFMAPYFTLVGWVTQCTVLRDRWCRGKTYNQTCTTFVLDINMFRIIKKN